MTANILTDELARLKKENNKLRNAIHVLLKVSGVNGDSVPMKKVQEAVDFAKKALKTTKHDNKKDEK